MPDMAEVNRQVIEEFRANGGEVRTGMFAGRRLLLLTTSGARTGVARTSPLMFFEHAGQLVVFGSHGGAPTNPGWYHNLKAHPEVTVELGPERYAARAVITSGAQRAELYAAAVAAHPFIAGLQERARREIPLVVLERHG